MRHFSTHLALVLLLAIFPRPAAAATFYVDQLTDDDGACTPGACSLREAALAANALPGLDILELIPGVHELTIPGNDDPQGYTGDFNFSEPVEIRGSTWDETVIDGNGIDGILDLSPWVNRDLTYVVSNLTLRDGARSNYLGGAILSQNAQLTIDRCKFVGNFSLGGGALFVRNTVTVIRDSSFFDNETTALGGAIRRSSYGNYPMLIENTTLSGNRAVYGGAIATDIEGVLTIRNSTVAANTATLASALLRDSGRADLVLESVVLDGTCSWQANDSPISLGGNLFKPASDCFLDHPTDQEVEDLGLGPLEGSENGLIHPLLPGSPAVDAAVSCPPHDQRGAHRPQDGDGDGVALCDSGAYELGTPNGLADIPVLPGFGLGLLAAGLALAALRRL